MGIIPDLSPLDEQDNACDPEASALEEVQKLLAEEKDARLEERFTFILTIIVLLDVIFFSWMPHWGGPLAIVLLQLILLSVLAKRLGLEAVVSFLDRLASGVGNKLGNGE